MDELDCVCKGWTYTGLGCCDIIKKVLYFGLVQFDNFFQDEKHTPQIVIRIPFVAKESLNQDDSLETYMLGFKEMESLESY